LDLDKTTAYNLLKSLTEDEGLRLIFETEKKYGARLYKVPKNAPLTKALMHLFSVIGKTDKLLSERRKILEKKKR